MEKVVRPELRTSEDNAKRSLSAAHQHGVTAVPIVEKHFALQSDCLAMRELTEAALILQTIRQLQKMSS